MMRARAYLALLMAFGVAGAAQGQPPNFKTAPIKLGQTIAAELTAGDAAADDGTLVDAYAFKGKKGQAVAIELKSRAFDPYLVLFSDEAKVASNDDAGRRSGDSRVTAILPKDGTYTILANAFEEGQTGAYSITLAAGGAAKPVTPRPQSLSFGKATAGELNDKDGRAADGSLYDLYRFKGLAGDAVQIVLRSRDFDAYLSIHKAGQADDLAFNDNEGRTSDSRLMFTLPAAGEYDIRANAAEAGEAGAYNLTLERQGAAAPRAEARSIGYGDTVRGELAFGDAKAPDDTYYDLYRFRGARGDEVKVVMRSADLDTYLSVRAQGSAKELAAADDDGFGERDAELPFVLPADGVYEIWANSMRRGESGAYVMSIEHIGRTPEAIAENPPGAAKRNPS